jgi:hypothetical protein
VLHWLRPPPLANLTNGWLPSPPPPTPVATFFLAIPNTNPEIQPRAHLKNGPDAASPSRFVMISWLCLALQKLSRGNRFPLVLENPAPEPEYINKVHNRDRDQRKSPEETHSTSHVKPKNLFRA